MTKASAASPIDDLAGYQYPHPTRRHGLPTVNEKDFRDCGFQRVWNPLAGSYIPMKEDLLPLPDFFAETLRETLDEWDVSQAEVSPMTELQRKWCRHPACILQSQRKCTQIRPLSLSQTPSSPAFWLRLQLDYDLMRAERENGEILLEKLTDFPTILR